jgi:hypothetical protein
MSGFTQLLSHNSTASLAAGAAICLALAALFFVASCFKPTKRNADDDTSRPEVQKYQRLKLHCEDLRALSNLAIQRHMSDAEFLRHLHIQPCYGELQAHFDDDLQKRLKQEPADSSGRSILAVACLSNVERLEHELHDAISASVPFPARQDGFFNRKRFG